MGQQPVTDPRDDLRADCSRCFALCCVAPAFQRSTDFAIDKPAGVACLHLADDHRCTIHERLVPSGFPGCVAFDCFGAGQRLAQETFGGRDRRTHPDVAGPMLAAFPVMRGLHELLWYLREAVTWACPDDVRRDLQGALDEVEATAALPADRLLDADVTALQRRSALLLRTASAAVRRDPAGPDHAEADLAGADLRGRDLRGACLRGALLIGADLRTADLTRADLRGADLRGADLRGARLAEALCVTRTQLGSALGDGTTTLPAGLERPARWN